MFFFRSHNDGADCIAALDATFYDVYTHLAELHLAEVGIDVEWADVDVAMEERERWGDTLGYFSQRLYRLGIGRCGSE